MAFYFLKTYTESIKMRFGNMHYIFVCWYVCVSPMHGSASGFGFGLLHLITFTIKTIIYVFKNDFFFIVLLCIGNNKNGRKIIC